MVYISLIRRFLFTVRFNINILCERKQETHVTFLWGSLCEDVIRYSESLCRVQRLVNLSWSAIHELMNLLLWGREPQWPILRYYPGILVGLSKTTKVLSLRKSDTCFGVRTSTYQMQIKFFIAEKRAAWCNINARDLYSEGNGFKSRPSYRLSCLRFPWFSSGSPREY
jgi:hypothetical protein